MKEITFKIINPEIVDCSSYHSTIYPDPESGLILLQILLGVCESEAVSRIGEFSYGFNNEIYSTPKVDASNYGRPHFQLQQGKEAELNKLDSLYVEPKEYTIKRFKEDFKISVEMGIIENPVEFKYIIPGLDGIRLAVSHLINILQDQNPPSLYGASLGVIWKLEEQYSKLPNGRYDHIDYERSVIQAFFHSSEIRFAFSTHEMTSEMYSYEEYLTHLDIIQKVLEDVVPGKYEADPFDREDLLVAGFLKRDGWRHIVPKGEEKKKAEEKYRQILRSKY